MTELNKNVIAMVQIYTRETDSAIKNFKKLYISWDMSLRLNEDQTLVRVHGSESNIAKLQTLKTSWLIQVSIDSSLKTI